MPVAHVYPRSSGTGSEGGGDDRSDGERDMWDETFGDSGSLYAEFMNAVGQPIPRRGRGRGNG